MSTVVTDADGRTDEPRAPVAALDATPPTTRARDRTDRERRTDRTPDRGASGASPTPSATGPHRRRVGP
jgi:hypothetical protein